MAICVEDAARGAQIIWGSPTYAQSRIAFEETQKSSAGYADFNQSRMEVRYPRAGRIMFGSLDNPDSLRGHTADGVVIDETPHTDKRAWYEVLQPMLADTGGWAWWIYTPNGLDWVWQEDMLSADRQDTARWQIPTLGVEITDAGLIRKPHPLENPDIKFDEIQRQFRSMPERLFRQEFMAEYLDLEGGVFRRITEAATAEIVTDPQPGRQYVAGVDVASSVDFTVVTVFDVEAKTLVFMDRFNRVSFDVLEDRLAAIYNRYKMVNMAIETNSIGQGVIDHLYTRGMTIYPFTTTAGTKDAIVKQLQTAFEHGEIKIINDPVLVGELMSFESKRNASGSFSYSAPDGMHDDCVMSTAIGWNAISAGFFSLGIV
jgi:phage terminase large subunit-like protein